MAEDIKPPSDGQAQGDATGGADVKNLKAEFDRKMSKLEAANAALLAEMQKLTRGGAQPPAPKNEPPKPPDPFDDPSGYAEYIAAKAEERTMKRVEKRDEDKARLDGAVSSLYQEYPELADSENPMTKKVLERYEALPPEERKDPRTLRLAALETAQEMGVKPKKLREESDDDDSFTMPTGSYGQPRNKRPSNKPDQRMLDFARRVGLNIDDPKVVERLNKRSRGEKV
jgi:hypothetical protein